MSSKLSWLVTVSGTLDDIPVGFFDTREEAEAEVERLKGLGEEGARAETNLLAERIGLPAISTVIVIRIVTFEGAQPVLAEPALHAWRNPPAEWVRAGLQPVV